MEGNVQWAVCRWVVVSASVWLWHKLQEGVGTGDCVFSLCWGAWGCNAGCVEGGEWRLTGHRHVLQKGVRCPSSCRTCGSVREARADPPATTCLREPLDQSWGAPLTVLWGDQVTEGRRGSCPWEFRATGRCSC